MRERIVAVAWDLAREHGLTGFSLRDLGAAVGMRAPSLFVYFDGKNALYDAMYDTGWEEFRTLRRGTRWPSRATPRARVKAFAHLFAEFALEDPVRYQLLNQRVVPGFEPSAASWSRALADWDELAEEMRALGVRDAVPALDLFTALLSGLLSQQLANDPGGTRWSARIDEVVEMWCDHYGLPARAGRDHGGAR
jgi:AcrR family transcriptional regulator